MKIRGIVVALIIVVALLASAAFVGATCSTTGKIIYVSRSGSYLYVYMAPNTSLPTYYFYYRTNNAQFMEQVLAAQGGNLKVNVLGNASTCPTSGTYRYGGDMSSISTYTLY